MAKAAKARALDVASAAALERVRIPFVQRASLETASGVREVFLVDLGLSGVFVETAEPLARGQRASIRFRLPGNAIPVVASCEVAWSHAGGPPPRSLPRGMGLHFLELAATDRERVKDYLGEHCRQKGRARSFARPWPLDEPGGGEP